MGPQPDGRFTPEEIVRLKHIGEWMKYNSEAIYETTGSPFDGEYKWGSLTTKGNKTYLHLFSWAGGLIRVNGILTKVKKAYLLHNKEELTFEQDVENANLEIIIPEKYNATILPVVVLVFDSEMKTDVNKGPKTLPKKIDHLTRTEVSGVISKVDGIDFTLDNGKKAYSFSLNENVKYRINESGEILEVQGFHLQKGKKYKVIYSAFDKPEVNLITLITK